MSQGKICKVLEIKIYVFTYWGDRLRYNHLK